MLFPPQHVTMLFGLLHRISTFSRSVSHAACLRCLRLVISIRELRVNQRKFTRDIILKSIALRHLGWWIDATVTKLYSWRSKSTRSHKPASCTAVGRHTYFITDKYVIPSLLMTYASKPSKPIALTFLYISIEFRAPHLLLQSLFACYVHAAHIAIACALLPSSLTVRFSSPSEEILQRRTNT